MDLSRRERRAIAGRARTLHERLEGPSNDPGEGGPFDPDGLVEEWVDVFPDRAAFEARLDRDGLDESTVREHLAASRWPADEPLPDWVAELDSLLAHLARQSPGDPSGVSVPGDTPFAELLAPIAGYARQELAADLPGDFPTAGLEEWLVTRLEMVCLQALYVEFKSFVEYHDPDLATADPASVPDPPTGHYEAFVDSMLGDGFRNLCLEYPVLARMVVEQLDQWTDLVETLARRVRADRAALGDRFGVEGAVIECEPLADDSHARGQVPVRVSFESGAAMYKPRPVGMGTTLAAVLDRVGDHLDVPVPDPPGYLPREGYGWMEPVDPRDVDDRAAADRYYARAGVLLCVAYVLGLTDCHHENVIAAGDHPTVVDAETAFAPAVPPDAVPATTAVRATVADCVLSTGLLPWSVGDPGEGDGAAGGGAGPETLAGFGAADGQVEVTTERPTVEAVNTDVMTVTDGESTVDRRASTPSVRGSPRPPGDHLEALVRGFEATYRTVRELHEESRLLPDVVDPAGIAGAETRYIYRPTPRYSSVLQSAVSRPALRDGARLSVAFEELAVPFFDGRIDSGDYWPLYAAERRALRRFDVPRFATRPGETGLYHDGEPTGVETAAPGLERFRDRLDRMGPDDRRRQVSLLERCFESGAGRSAPPRSDSLPGEDQLRRTAVDCCESVIDAALDAGEARWTPRLAGDTTLALLPADDSLYNGRAGIGLALAAAHRVTGDDRFREWARAALDPVAESDPPAALGGFDGVGSTVYALSVAADLLDRPDYRARATEHALAVTADPDEDPLDVMSGTAGALLGLLAHHDRCGESAVLDRAVDCGERLLAQGVAVDGHRTWHTVGEAPIPGFAHGTSGIAYALARLGAATGEDRFADAAREAVAHVETQYDPDRGNYRNPTRSGEARYRDRWCYGRAGCELARIGVGTALDDAGTVETATDRLSATVAASASVDDQLCCGNLGRAMVLFAASRRTDRDTGDALALLGRTLARRDRAGSLSMPGHDRAVPNPTLFNGLSGVAYSLCRVLAPGTVPCVLLLE